MYRPIIYIDSRRVKIIYAKLLASSPLSSLRSIEPIALRRLSSYSIIYNR